LWVALVLTFDFALPLTSAWAGTLFRKRRNHDPRQRSGIPPEVKEKMFNPFFTTKPAGEGTGLGLSISHDIIVKQHGGSIELDTQPGAFTEFRIVLPRATVSASK
jgi:light-regulated signal transduction histidine kinase (bacteriophytochrome)